MLAGSRSQKSVICLTPVALEHDTRAIKVARSLIRLGYSTTVIEGVLSRNEIDGIDVIQLGGAISQSPARSPDNRSVIERIRQRVPPFARDMVLFYADKLRRFSLDYKRVIQSLKDVDCIYLHGCTYTRAVIEHCQKKQVKFVYDAHDFYSRIPLPDDVGVGFGRRIRRHERGLEEKCFASAGAIVTASPGLANLMHDSFGRQPEVIMNSHDPCLEIETDRDIRDDCLISASDFLIVSVGNAKAGQSILTLLDALARLPERFHLACVGSGYEQYGLHIEKLGLQRRTHLMGARAAPEVVPYIRSADMSVLTYYAASDNLKYALPNGFFQSLAAHLPIVYSPDLLEVSKLCVPHAVGRQINVHDPQAYANAIEQFSEESGSKLGNCVNYEVLLSEIEWSKQEQKLAAVMSAMWGSG